MRSPTRALSLRIDSSRLCVLVLCLPTLIKYQFAIDHGVVNLDSQSEISLIAFIYTFP